MGILALGTHRLYPEVKLEVGAELLHIGDLVGKDVLLLEVEVGHGLVVVHLKHIAFGVLGHIPAEGNHVSHLAVHPGLEVHGLQAAVQVELCNLVKRLGGATGGTGNGHEGEER